jgi:hypothetical protein
MNREIESRQGGRFEKGKRNICDLSLTFAFDSLSQPSSFAFSDVIA